MSWPHANVEPRTLACDSDGRSFVVTDGITLFSAELGTDIDVRRRAREPLALRVPNFELLRPSWLASFKEVPCDAVLGQNLQDVAVACPEGAHSRALVSSRGNNSSGCEALVLHRHGRQIASCKLDAPEATSGVLTNISDSWLEQVRISQTISAALPGNMAEAPHARIEKAVAVAANLGCKAGSGPSWASCLLLGTSRGRVVHLEQRRGAGSALLPAAALRDQAEVGEEPWGPGAMRPLNGRYFGVLSASGRSITVLDGRGGSPAGKLTLPMSLNGAGGFCAGGGHLFMLGTGPSPPLWRMPLPSELNVAAAGRGTVG